MRAKRIAAAAVLLALSALAQELRDRFRESVSADRVVVDVHAIDNVGNPVTGLSATDFVLRVDGRPVSIESVEWVSSEAAPVPAASAAATGTDIGESTAAPP